MTHGPASTLHPLDAAATVSGTSDTQEAPVATAAPAPTSKTCPGFAPGGQAPHELPATRENFASNAGNRDGLSTRCKTCSSAYNTAWSKAKKAGQKFTVKAPGSAAAVREAPTAARTSESYSKPATLHVDAPTPPQFRDQLAVRASRGKAAGYTAEEVDGVTYALPTSPEAVHSREGQAALAAVNEARAQARRKRDRDRKRTERFEAKRKAAATA